MSNSGKILVVDDEVSIRESLELILHKSGYTVSTCSNGSEAVQMVKKKDFDIVITDLKMDGLSGINVLDRIKKIKPETLVIMMTGYASLDTALASIRKGAFDYLMKPFQVETLKLIVQRSIEMKRLSEKNTLLLNELKRKNRELSQANTKLKKAQQQLLETERVAAISETIAALHHEINNPLTALLGKIQLLITQKAVGENELIQALKYLEDRTLRVSRIMEKLVTITRPCSTDYVAETTMLDIERSD